MAALAALTAVAVGAPRTAQACGGDFGPEERTTFDPDVLGDGAETALFWNPDTKSIGNGPCEDCAAKEMKDDWQTFFGQAVPWADWSKILLSAALPEIDALIQAMKNAHAQPPHGFESNAIFKLAGARRDDAIAALYFVGFARRVEPFAAAPPSDWETPKPQRAPEIEPQTLIANGDKALARAKMPFLRQRYAFQLARLRFYTQDWPDVVSFCQKNRTALDSPAPSLKWRAQYYVAGALLQMNERARANLTLARIHAGWPALASVTAQDFKPMQQDDWKDTLARASSVKEKVELWRLVGLKLDALEAMKQIAALDPRSTRLAVLAVREVNREEATSTDLTALGRLCGKLADNPATDRRWLFDLVAGHAAALRGDVAQARRRLASVRAAQQGNELVEKQAAASLAMALSRSCGRPEPRCEDELARNIAEVDANFSRWYIVRESVRAKLSEGYHARGRCVEAELFGAGACSEKWSDPRFVESMIARVSGPPTAFDRFMIDNASYSRDGLRTELALMHFRRGDFETAKRQFQDKDVGAEPIPTDPFVIHIRDCHDCDQKKYANGKWTHAKLALRMINLRKLADRPGKVGAEAAFDLGNGYYNITWYGNARSFLDGTHVTADVNEAEIWYKRAFDAFPDREDKARAAFMAAKSELARMLEKKEPSHGEVDPLPIPGTWFPIVRSFSDTKYYREILQECGHYRRWAKRQK
jgi:hypothetical protein